MFDRLVIQMPTERVELSNTTDQWNSTLFFCFLKARLLKTRYSSLLFTYLFIHKIANFLCILFFFISNLKYKFVVVAATTDAAACSIAET